MKKHLLCVATALIFSNVIAQLPTANLMAYYQFGGNANDMSGNGNNGTVFGATLTTDRFGNPNSAYNFDGNDSIRVSHSTSLQLSGNAISISFWVKYNSFAPVNDNNILISKQIGSGTTQSGYNVAQGVNNDGNTYYLVSNGTGNLAGESTGTLSLGQWYHIVCIYDNGTATVYLNGTVVNTSTATAVIGANTMPLLFGAANWSNPNAIPLDGALDDICLYDRAITPTEVTQLYNLGVGIQEQSNSSVFSIYPNPAIEKITINFESQNAGIVNIALLDLQGRIIKYDKQSVMPGINAIEYAVDEVNPGLYFIRIGNITRKIQIR